MSSSAEIAFKNYNAEVEVIEEAFESFYDEMDACEDDYFSCYEDLDEEELTEAQEVEAQEAEAREAELYERLEETDAQAWARAEKRNEIFLAAIAEVQARIDEIHASTTVPELETAW